MTEPAPAAISPRVWIAVLGVLGTVAAGCVSFLVGVVALGGILVSYGGWKSGVDQHLITQDAHIAAVEANTEKQILSLTASCKDMVTTMSQSLGEQIKNIEQDRKTHITEADHWREQKGAELTELKTIVTQQQREITLLSEANTRRTPAR